MLLIGMWTVVPAPTLLTLALAVLVPEEFGGRRLGPFAAFMARIVMAGVTAAAVVGIGSVGWSSSRPTRAPQSIRQPQE